MFLIDKPFASDFLINTIKENHFKIVATKYRNRRKRFGLRFNLICALVNFDRGFAVK